MTLFAPPVILERRRSGAVLRAAEQAGYTPLQARILAGRMTDAQAPEIARAVTPLLGDLDPPDFLPDIDIAASRIAQAVVTGEDILLVSDHDVDGASGMAVMREVFLDIFHHPAERLFSFMGHRLQEGYGLSSGVADRIIAAGHRRGLLITSDMGSADEPRIAQLRDAGIDTIVTDHHEVDVPPPSALATVNPTRADSEFPDKFIAGCHTTWLVLAAARRELIECGYLPAETPTLARCIDILAGGVIADCVSMSQSRNNRLLVQRGLAMMSRADARPCWQAFRELIDKPGPVEAQDVAFILGPMINARGRLDENMLGVRFLRAQTLDQARELIAVLAACNEERKEIERVMKDQAMVLATAQVAAGADGLALWLEQGSGSVHGIVASRIVEAFGRPTVCLSPSHGDPELITGSVRTVNTVHVRETLRTVDAMHPGLLVGYGGHRGAGGLRLRRPDIPVFQQAWDAAVKAQGHAFRAECLTDGALGAQPTLQLLAELNVLAPYGRGFEAPVFSEPARVLATKVMGKDRSHLRVTLLLSGQHPAEAVWFRAMEPNAPAPVSEGDWVQVAYELDVNHYKGRSSLQLKVRAAQRVDLPVAELSAA